MNDDNNEMKIELPSLKGQNNESANSNGPVLSEKTESAIVYSDAENNASSPVTPVIEENKEESITPIIEEKHEEPITPVAPAVEEKQEAPMAPVTPVIEEHKEENINFGANLETPKPEVNQTPLTNNSDNVYVSNSVANANTINQEPTPEINNANINPTAESVAPATEPYTVNTPSNDMVTPMAPVSEPTIEPSNVVNEPAPINNPTPVEPMVAPVITPTMENNARPVTNVNPSVPTENNNVANPNIGPVNNPQPVNNIPTNPQVTNNTAVTTGPKVNKASKKATIIGTIIALIITGLLLFWFIYNYCIIN